jgi:uncharacterized protein YacL (UPF0231 family)
MKLSDLAHFYDETIRSLCSSDDLSGLVTGCEVLLTPSVDHDEVILQQGEIVIGCDFSDRDFWLTAAGQYLWLVQAVKVNEILLKSIKILPINSDSDIDINIAVDEKIRDDIAKRARFNNPSIEEVAKWLSDEFIESESDSDRVFQASYRETEEKDNELSLIGRNFSLVLEVTADSTLWIRRLLPKPRNKSFSLVLLKGSVSFVDATVAAKLSSPEEVEKLKRLRHDQKSYIALWEKYDQISSRMALKQARQLGYVRYVKYEIEVIAKGVEWRFFFREDQHSTVEQFCKTVSSQRDSQLEVHRELPAWLTNEDSPSVTDNRGQEKSLKATLGKLDRRYLVLNLERGVSPTKEGFIYLSSAELQLEIILIIFKMVCLNFVT